MNDHFRQISAGLCAVAIGIALSSCQRADKAVIKALIVTGGHDFEHAAFYSMFDSMTGIHYDTLTQPTANEVIASPGVDAYDVLVFYDMPDSITPGAQKAYVDLLNRGKAMVFIHHALVSYQRWPEFIRIVGGQYHTHPVVVGNDTLKANYEHDVSLPVTVRPGHPIVDGISDFTIVDERYGDAEISSTVTPLLTTAYPGSMKTLAWINHYGNSDVVYIQLGHGPTAYRNTNFRKLIYQAIDWSATHHAIRR